MELEQCDQCERFFCDGTCAAWIDGDAYTVRELVAAWGIQARQVREHLENGTHPRCADGSIVRRIDDGVRLRPCRFRGAGEVSIRAQGMLWIETGLSSAAAALGVPRSSLHDLIREPGRPIPRSWDCEALATPHGWHYRAPYKKRG